ncbi:MAG TPA: Yip1 family protein [Pyrinomonadaceae bacterium]
MDAERETPWQEPPLPEQIRVDDDPPQMSEAATLGNIFIEPGRTFEDLRRKPRFILAGLIIALLATAYGFGLYYKIGDEGIRRFVVEQIDKSPRADQMTAEQKNTAVNLQMTIQKVVRFALPVFVAISFVLGGLFYWLGAKAFGGTGNFLHGLSVWIYSGLPPAVLAMIANFIVLIFKSADDIELATSQRGVIQANLSFLVNGKSMPVLATLISVFDLFAIWGWILAAIGLQKTNKISSGSAWTITIILALIGVLLRVVGAFFSGNPN